MIFITVSGQFLKYKPASAVQQNSQLSILQVFSFKVYEIIVILIAVKIVFHIFFIIALKDFTNL